MPDVTHAELVNQMSALVNSWQTYLDQLRVYHGGTADAVIASPAGQPAPGWYPLTDPAGLVSWHPCTARVRADASADTHEFIQMIGTNTLNLDSSHSGKTLTIVGTTPSSIVTVNAPPGVAAGWWTGLIQGGTGAGRLVVAMPGNGFLKSRGSAFRSAGDDAEMMLRCRNRDGAGRSTISVTGDRIV